MRRLLLLLTLVAAGAAASAPRPQHRQDEQLETAPLLASPSFALIHMDLTTGKDIGQTSSFFLSPSSSPQF
jgi:hypothetical protein